MSVLAQQNVPIPEGLILKENLADLAIILSGDYIVPTTTTSFSLRSHHNREMEEEPEQVVELTALLAERHKWHGLYYLPTIVLSSY